MPAPRCLLAQPACWRAPMLGRAAQRCPACNPAPAARRPVRCVCTCAHVQRSPASGAPRADVEYADNLRYFLEFGVQPGDACDYLVVVQSGRGVLSTSLPPLPPNVRAVQHPNECFDWGTFGWVSWAVWGGSPVVGTGQAVMRCAVLHGRPQAHSRAAEGHGRHAACKAYRPAATPDCKAVVADILQVNVIDATAPVVQRHACTPSLLQAIERGHADTSRYRYIIFLNSSVRGPFLPSYWPVSRQPWCNEEQMPICQAVLRLRPPRPCRLVSSASAGMHACSAQPRAVPPHQPSLCPRLGGATAAREALVAHPHWPHHRRRQACGGHHQVGEDGGLGPSRHRWFRGLRWRQRGHTAGACPRVAASAAW